MSKIKEDDFPGAALLIEAGYTTEAKIDNATDDELLAIEHLGPETLKKIREARAVPPALEEETKEEGEATPHKCSNPTCGYEITVSPCPYCGVA